MSDYNDPTGAEVIDLSNVSEQPEIWFDSAIYPCVNRPHTDERWRQWPNGYLIVLWTDDANSLPLYRTGNAHWTTDRTKARVYQSHKRAKAIADLVGRFCLPEPVVIEWPKVEAEV